MATFSIRFTQIAQQSVEDQIEHFAVHQGIAHAYQRVDGYRVFYEIVEADHALKKASALLQLVVGSIEGTARWRSIRWPSGPPSNAPPP